MGFKPRPNPDAFDMAAFIESAWEATDFFVALAKRYKRTAKSVPELALAMARIKSGQDTSLRALAEGAMEGVGPLLASMLSEENEIDTAINVFRFNPAKLPRPIPALQKIAVSKRWSANRAQGILARSPHEEDRNAIKARIAKSPKSAEFDDLRALLAMHGDDSQDTWLEERLARAANTLGTIAEKNIASGKREYYSRNDYSPLAVCIEAAGHRKLTATVPSLVALLYYYDSIEACLALGAIGDSGAIEPLQRYLSMVVGRRRSVAPFHLAAEFALIQLGVPQSTETATYVLEELYPTYYGWPKVEDLVQLKAIAGRILIAQGTPKERRSIATWRQSHTYGLRAVGEQACMALKQKTAPLHYCDPAYLDALVKSEGLAALAPLLDRDDTVYRELVAIRLLKGKDSALAAKAMDWACSHLDSQQNFYVDEIYSVRSLEADLLSAVKAKRKAHKPRLQKSSGLWIKHLVLGKGNMPPNEEVDESAEGISASVTRFDALADDAFDGHDNNLQSVHFIDDETVFTTGWNGRGIRWSKGQPEKVFHLKDGVSGVVHVGESSIAIATGSRLVLMDIESGNQIAQRKGSGREVGISPKSQLVWNDRHKLKLVEPKTLKDKGTAITVGTDCVTAIRWAHGGFLVGTESGEVSFVKKGKRVWSLLHHGMDRLERGTSHKDICDLLILPNGFVTSGNDNTVRFYEWDGTSEPKRRHRLHLEYVGIFNKMALSPSKRLLAIPGSRSFSLYDIDKAKFLLQVPRKSFANEELTVVSFRDEENIVAGTSQGSLFSLQVRGV